MIFKILNVDLTDGRHWVEEVSLEETVKYLGGRGMAARLLYQRLKPGTDPLGPENILIFAPGVLTGTTAPSSGRTSVLAKGPATSLYLKSSVGGHWGAELRFAGWDILVIYGQALDPVYLWIDDDQVALQDASDLWGKGTRATEDAIKEALNDPGIQVACIGPAGENQVLFSCIMASRYHAAGRGGIGAVMGSKNLKAIAVRGTGGVQVANPQTFFHLTNRVRYELTLDAGTHSLTNYGTSGSTLALNEMWMLPSRNFQQARLPQSEKLSGQYLVEEGYLRSRVACYACSTGCHRSVVTRDGSYGGISDQGPELEAMLALGGECGVTDTEAVLKANQLCADLGLDVISTGSVIAWAMESYERGLLSEADTGGHSLHWGDGRTLVELLPLIAERKGLGELLAQGVKRASEQIGGDSWKWAIQAKGLEQSGVDTRVAKSYALAFAVNPRGPDHLMTETFAEFGVSPEARKLIEKICGDEKYANPLLTEKRAEIVRWHEDVYAATESMGICVFTSTAAYAVTPENMAQMMGLALGLEVSEEDLMAGGRRVVTIERCFNVREGATRKDDTLPWRMMHEGAPSGPNAGVVTSQDELSRMLDEYYDLHGWDKETARPTPQTLEALGLSWIIDSYVPTS
jgi:aldehyde:ferredoxin oxidoreductase